MHIKIVLNGGLRTCCSSYPAEYIRETLSGWITDKEKTDLSVIDRQEEPWKPDMLAEMAYTYFGEKIYPLIYINDVLVGIGYLPDREYFLSVARGERPEAITEEDILEAANHRKE